MNCPACADTQQLGADGAPCPACTSLRRQIVHALIQGFHPDVRSVLVGETETQVFVRDFDLPIVVTANDVVLPDELKPLAPAIRLDVQTILSTRLPAPDQMHKIGPDFEAYEGGPEIGAFYIADSHELALLERSYVKGRMPECLVSVTEIHRCSSDEGQADVVAHLMTKLEESGFANSERFENWLGLVVKEATHAPVS